jgi:hypothetical protein
MEAWNRSNFGNTITDRVVTDESSTLSPSIYLTYYPCLISAPIV